MDARLRPEDALGLALGEAHVIRNAGGRVTDDVVRSLMLSSAVLGTRRVAVIHHTDCGLLGATDEMLRDRVAAATGERVDDVEFLAFDDAEGTLLDDVRAIEQDARLPFDEVSGFLYDVATGRLVRGHGAGVNARRPGRVPGRRRRGRAAPVPVGEAWRAGT